MNPEDQHIEETSDQACDADLGSANGGFLVGLGVSALVWKAADSFVNQKEQDVLASMMDNTANIKDYMKAKSDADQAYKNLKDIQQNSQA